MNPYMYVPEQLWSYGFMLFIVLYDKFYDI